MIWRSTAKWKCAVYFVKILVLVQHKRDVLFSQLHLRQLTSVQLDRSLSQSIIIASFVFRLAIPSTTWEQQNASADRQKNRQLIWPSASDLDDSGGDDDGTKRGDRGGGGGGGPEDPGDPAGDDDNSPNLGWWFPLLEIWVPSLLHSNLHNFCVCQAFECKQNLHWHDSAQNLVWAWFYKHVLAKVS